MTEFGPRHHRRPGAREVGRATTTTYRRFSFVMEKFFFTFPSSSPIISRGEKKNMRNEEEGGTRRRRRLLLSMIVIVVEKYTLLREERSLSPKMMSVVYACTPERRGGRRIYIYACNCVVCVTHILSRTNKSSRCGERQPREKTPRETRETLPPLGRKCHHVT